MSNESFVNISKAFVATFDRESDGLRGDLVGFDLLRAALAFIRLFLMRLTNRFRECPQLNRQFGHCFHKSIYFCDYRCNVPVLPVESIMDRTSIL